MFEHDTGGRFFIVRGPNLKNYYAKTIKYRDLSLWHLLPNAMHYMEKINQTLKTFALINKARVNH